MVSISEHGQKGFNLINRPNGVVVKIGLKWIYWGCPLMSS